MATHGAGPVYVNFRLYFATLVMRWPFFFVFLCGTQNTPQAREGPGSEYSKGTGELLQGPDGGVEAKESQANDN